MDKKKLQALITFVLLLFVIIVGVIVYGAFGKQIDPSEVLSPASVSVPNQDGSPANPVPFDKMEDAVAQKASDFTVYDKEGNAVSLSDFVGKPVIVNFWASWCPPCKGEMPVFNSAFAEYGDTISFVMVDMVGQRESQENGENYVSDAEYSFPIYFDTDQNAALTYGIASIPTSLFIDGDGNLITYAVGAIDEDALAYGISLLLSPPETSVSVLRPSFDPHDYIQRAEAVAAFLKSIEVPTEARSS
ncbi:TlpA family protein disulfide reductase [Lachnospiraceae bacterium ZAX-1]